MTFCSPTAIEVTISEVLPTSCAFNPDFAFRLANNYTKNDVVSFGYGGEVVR
jgi:hypothetical protein